MIRPWYRSRLFWLGIPGLLFLLWLWVGSIVEPTTAYLSPSPRSQWKVASDSGALLLHTQSFVEPSPDWDASRRLVIQDGDVSPPAFPHRPFYLKNTYIEPTKTHHHFSWYAYWFLLLLYVLPWASWIGFRQWRKRKY